jgi:O-antigen/teichoic acid export membrane protein
MITVLAKLGPVGGVGEFALGLAIASPVIMFTNLQLRSVQAIDVRNEYQFADYLGLRLVTTTLAFTIIVGVALWGGYSWERAWVIMVIGIAKSLESMSDIIYGLFQRYERLDKIAISMIIRGSVSLLAVAVAMYLTKRVLWAVVALALVYGAVLVAYDTRNGTTILQSVSKAGAPIVGAILLPRAWRPRVLVKLTRLALPLGVVMLLISLNINIPRYFIEHYFGERGLGYFAAITSLTMVGNTFIFALGQSASPRLAQYYTGDLVAFTRLLLRLLGIAAMVGLIGIVASLLFGREMLAIFYKPDYASYVDVFIWQMVAAEVGYCSSIILYGLTATGTFEIQVPGYVTTVCLTVLACAIVIPKLGLLGGAIAMTISAVYQLGLWTCILIVKVQHAPRGAGRCS